jgi:cellulose synthase/poly-beta-1,6-N-acetylglucosamine synthase-like glycosyltransferase
MEKVVSTSTQSPDMQRFSQLAGPLQPRPESGSQSVKYVEINSDDRLLYRIWTKAITYGSLLLVVGLAILLFQPAHWVALKGGTSGVHFVDWLMLIFLAILQVFLLVGTYSATRSTLKARDPVPMEPTKGLRVAFATTRAPGEPIEMVRRTLTAAKKVRYADGHVDVWLLDETRDLNLQELCDELDVKYFSRKGIEKWNSQSKRRSFKHVFKHMSQEDPRFASRTKHGNFNAWGTYLDTEHYHYDIIAGVDTDQVPEPNFLERLLGYFNDPDVAYVVGPQVYANYKHGMPGLVTRWAESQASFFQSTIQRAGNASDSAMFVGTNYAARTSALSQIRGFYPCITEDLATGVAIHASRNEITGNSWKSVYTPDVLALGEGPSFWAPFFSQQWRWAAGGFDACKRLVWRVFKELNPKARLHYFLILTYYPITALTWLFGVMSSLLYLFTGASAIVVAWNQFIGIYLMSNVLQMSVYFWNRRNNVSPFEQEGSYGISGMVMSSLTAPIYLSALMATTIGKKVSFVVTKKGSSENPDWLKAFKTHLEWGGLLTAGLIFGCLTGHNNPAMLIWIGSQLLVCLAPFVLGMSIAVPSRLRSRHAEPSLIPLGEPQNA